MTLEIKPLSDRVVIKPAEVASVTKGGIIIPDTAKEKPRRGEVLLVGPGAVNASGKVIPPTVKVGDFVLFGKNTGMPVELDGREYLIMQEHDIIVIL